MAFQQAHVSKSLSRVQTYKELLIYFYPELITSFILNFLVQFIDGWFISGLEQTEAYATLGITNTLFHFITKLAEGVTVGVIVICGKYNGKGEFKLVGQAAIDAFWTTCSMGAFVGSLVYFGAPLIYQFFGVSPNMIALGVPFIRLRAFSIFFTFVCFALIGFLRAIKNTHVTMYLFLIGTAVFVFFDYALVFGKCGFSCMAFQGSAFASIMQYASMSAIGLGYILLNKQTYHYGIRLFSRINFNHVWQLCLLSFPVMLDKASFALCGIWTAKCIGKLCVGGPLQTNILSSLTALKHIERFILLPALAFAQILTFVVSNSYKIDSFFTLTQTVKKILFLAASMVFVILFVMMYKPSILLDWLDVHHRYSEIVISALPFLGIIIASDVLQLLLSAILRGAGHVQLVMWTRIIFSLLLFLPLTWISIIFPIDSLFTKFMLVLLALSVSNAGMAIVYLFKIKNLSQQIKNL